MPFTPAPTMDYEQLYKDRARALAVTPQARPGDHDQLPAYSEAIKGRRPVHTQEEKPQKTETKKSSTWSAIKSILTLGDVQKHNPMYVLEKSLTGQPSAARASRDSR
ncbi:hypothetical protein Tdes44962_MAKER00528 [Teratosphaeria destructans]|uniref:Uncharacterized protein n=1 Tax=Teratosphaeria destructans TaxID=418781 RepID=A0A9W7SPX3_9PEZI|nr:hypothetical protein Tdes44962_MAKER00528 [Teratosphaeria destructans]